MSVVTLASVKQLNNQTFTGSVTIASGSHVKVEPVGGAISINAPLAPPIDLSGAPAQFDLQTWLTSTVTVDQAITVNGPGQIDFGGVVVISSGGTNNNITLNGITTMQNANIAPNLGAQTWNGNMTWSGNIQLSPGQHSFILFNPGAGFDFLSNVNLPLQNVTIDGPSPSDIDGTLTIQPQFVIQSTVANHIWNSSFSPFIKAGPVPIQFTGSGLLDLTQVDTKPPLASTYSSGLMTPVVGMPLLGPNVPYRISRIGNTVTMIMNFIGLIYNAPAPTATGTPAQFDFTLTAPFQMFASITNATTMTLGNGVISASVVNMGGTSYRLYLKTASPWAVGPAYLFNNMTLEWIGA